jgi:predicted DCC family thiol-disulfide oxidoreductase YuxK
LKSVSPPAIVLFDGVCNLCDATVQFLLDRDPDGRFVFASLQSDEGKRVLASVGRAPTPQRKDPETVVLVLGNQAYDKSTAALRIAARLGWPWKALAVLLVVPALVRDVVYDFVARNRYRWFGRHPSCRVPTPEAKTHFLANRPELLDGFP